MTDYGYIDIYARGTSALAARMYFEPKHQYTDAANGAVARLTVRFTAYMEIMEPRFNLMAGSGVIGSVTWSHTFVPVGEGDPVDITITITDDSAFTDAPRENALGISVDTADRSFMTITPALCGITALTYRLSPVVSCEGVLRCDEGGIRRPDGVHARVNVLALERREEWSGDASALTVRTVTLTPTQGAARTITIPEDMLNRALESDYTELLPLLLEGMDYAASEDWTIVFTVGFSADNVTSVTVVMTKAWANMHMSGARTGGVCFGGFSRSTLGHPMLESEYPFYPYGGIVGLSAFPSGEQLIGTAPNGKPLYAQTFTKTGIPHANSGTVTVIGTIPDIEHVVLFNGARKRSDGYFIQIPYYYADNQFSYFSVELATGNLRFTHSDGSGSSTSDVVVTVWYTKADE